MAELQCPNCGGYKSEKLGTFSRLLGKIFSYGVSLIVAYIGGNIFGAFFLHNMQLVVFGVMALTVVGCLWNFFTTFQPNKVSCLLCGLKWDERNYPKGTVFRVQQDLIDKGNIRLEQERLESERQRYQEEQRRQQGLQ